MTATLSCRRRQHDSNYMLGATTAGTAEVTKNEKGLRHDAADVARPALELPPHYARTL